MPPCFNAFCFTAAWNVKNMKSFIPSSQGSSFHLRSFQNFRCFIEFKDIQTTNFKSWHRGKWERVLWLGSDNIQTPFSKSRWGLLEPWDVSRGLFLFPGLGGSPSSDGEAGQELRSAQPQWPGPGQCAGQGQSLIGPSISRDLNTGLSLVQAHLCLDPALYLSRCGVWWSLTRRRASRWWLGWGFIIIIGQSQYIFLITDQSQVSMDNESSENWWDTVDLTKLILACNKISSISPKVTMSTSLQSDYI